MRVYRLIRPLTQSSHLGSGAILPHALPSDVARQWEDRLQTGCDLPDVAQQTHAAFPLSQVGGMVSRAGQSEAETPVAGIWRKLKRVAQKAVASVVLFSLQLGVISPLGHALAQSQSASGQPNWVVPNTGYAPNGEMYINGQRIGLSQDPFHQQQHNNQVPGLFFIDAVQFTKPLSDPSYAMGNLAQMENHTVNLHLPAFDVLFTRLYLTIENPYPTSAVTPPNYSTYRDALTAAQGANYTPVVAGPENTTFAFKTLTSPNAGMRNLLVTEIPTHPDFQAALERPNGTPAGAVGARVGLNGEMAALQDYIKNTKPYDFSYQSAMGPYANLGANGTQRAQYNANGALDIDPMKDSASFFMNWTLGSTDVQNQLAQAQKDGKSVDQAMGSLVYDSVTGRYYIPSGAAQEGQTNIFDASFMAMAAPQVATGGRYEGQETGGSGLPEWSQLNQAQKESQAWHQEQQTIARTQAAQTAANQLDFSQFASVNALFGQGYDLYRYNPSQAPNGEAENALMRRLMNGELTPGTPDYEQAEKITQQRYREQYAAQQITGSKLNFSLTDGQAKANSLNLNDINPNELFGQGFNLFNYAQSEEERSLLTRLQAGQLVVGSEEYERAAAAARQAFRNAYADNLVNGTKKTYNDSAASYQANKLDLTDTSVTELFGSGLDLYRWAHTDEEKSLLRRLQSGELRDGTDEYKKALALAQQYYRNAYAEMLNPPPPPPPKKVPKWKKIVAVVLAAVATYFTAGAASLWAGGLLGGTATATVAGVATTVVAGTAGTALTVAGAVASAVGGIVGSAAGAFVSAAITTGDIGAALQAAGNAIVSGSIRAIVTNVVSGMLGLSGITGGLTDAIGSTATNIVVNSLSNAAAQTALNGGSFGDNLATAVVNSVVDVAAQNAANWIGDTFVNTDGTNLANYAAHGVLGCATAAARGQDCAAGAIGAVAGEIAAATGAIGNMAAGIGVTLNGSDTAFFGGVIGGAVAAATGTSDDVDSNFSTGQTTGSNAVANNYLKHTDVALLEKELTRCGTDLACRNKAFDDAFLASAKNDIELLQCASKGNCEQLKAEYRKGYEAITDLLDKGVSSNDVTRILSMENNAQMIIRNNLMTCRTADCKERAEFLLGVAKSIAWVTPTGALVGTGMGSYALMTSVLQNGVTDTTLNALKAIADLPTEIRNGLNSSDPQKRGEAIGAMLALGLGVGALAKDYVRNTFASLKISVSDADAARIANNFGKDGDAFSAMAEKLREGQSQGWKKADGAYVDVPNGGKVPGTEFATTIPVGSKIDRYGGTSDTTHYLSPSGVTIDQRALPPYLDINKYDQYEVIKPLPVQQSNVYPFYGKNGMGVQYDTKAGSGYTVKQLVDRGYIKKIN